MRLELSIWEDGFTMPCVCYYDKEKDVYILVDGFPPLFCAEDFETYLSERKRDVAYCGNRKDLSNRMSSTIRHNRAGVRTI